MKKVFTLVLALLLLVSALPLAVGAADNTVVYLKGNASGSGASAEDPCGSLEDAYDALDLTKDCTIVVCGEFTQAATFLYDAAYTGSVTLTSQYGGVDYRKTAGACFITGAFRYVCTGALTLRDIDYCLTGNYYFVIAQHNPILIDTGVTMESTAAGFTGASISNGFSILGGFQNAQPTVFGGENPPAESALPVNVTVRSGKNIVIAAYSRQIKSPVYTGKATVTVEGDADVGFIYYAPVNVEFDCPCDVEVNLRGNARIRSMTGGTSAGTIKSFTLNWESGELESFAYANRSGVETVATEGYTLNYSKAAEDATFYPLIAFYFDTLHPTFDKTVTDAPVTTAAPTTAAPVTTKAPATTKAPTTAAPSTDAPATTVPSGSDGAVAEPTEGANVALIAGISAAAVVAAVAVVLLLKKKKA